MFGNRIHIDSVIVGGGITGLWLLNVLRARGYSAILCEAENLGGAQTLASQGIIHGGLKYALKGAPTPASEALSQAPGRWRACLAGRGEIDLGGLEPSSDRLHLFAGAGVLARLSAFLADKALRGRVERLRCGDFPEALGEAAFQGAVYRLEDFALDTTALIAHLAALASGAAYRHTLVPETCVEIAQGNRNRSASQTSRGGTLPARRGNRLGLSDGQSSRAGWAGGRARANGGDGVRIRLGDHELLANRLILAAGAGNEALMKGLEISNIPMQRRPLHQVIVRHPELPRLFGHWLGDGGRAEPRLTITSHPPRHRDERSGTIHRPRRLPAGQPATDLLPTNNDSCNEQQSNTGRRHQRHHRLALPHPQQPLRPLLETPDLTTMNRSTTNLMYARTGPLLWYLGGYLATSGAGRDTAAQCQYARKELEACFPRIDWRRADFRTIRIDRAEPRQPAGLRPGYAFVGASGDCLVCWPTKLTLVPDLADRVLSLLPPPQYPSPGPLHLPAATVGRAPWEL